MDKDQYDRRTSEVEKPENKSGRDGAGASVTQSSPLKTVLDKIRAIEDGDERRRALNALNQGRRAKQVQHRSQPASAAQQDDGKHLDR